MALVCWKCGASIEELPQPLERLATCHACLAELHVCKLCQFYNPRVSDKCDEPLAAGSVREVDRANFCDYFKPKPDVFTATDSSAADAAKAELEALFGIGDSSPASPTTADEARSELDKLFDESPGKPGKD